MAHACKQIRHMMLERYQEVLRDQAELEALCLSEYPEAKEAYEQEVSKFVPWICVVDTSTDSSSPLNESAGRSGFID